MNPCARCKGEGELKHRVGSRFGFCVICKNCGACTMFTRSEAAAVALWNMGKVAL